MARMIAFYLPQYHPIPENDEWWGKGFTEWTNVSKAKPMFRDHYQPHLPADLGFYDLRVPETRIAQAEMAREYGVEAFCYYHYWFAGKRILERPFNEVLASGQPEFPFCLCWANQTWTGIWHGCPGRILIEQTYPGIEDYRAHFAALLPAFLDKRYVTIDGKPLLLIYRPTEIPAVKELLEFWRHLAVRAGLPGMHMVAVLHNNRPWDHKEFGFDATVSQQLPTLKQNHYGALRESFRKLKRYSEKKLGRPTTLNYEEVVLGGLAESTSGPQNYPCILPNWDNTPRSGRNGIVLHGSTPELFREQIKKSLEITKGRPPEHRLVFIKAWNEWAEGNHLEPDIKFGRAYLEAIREEVLE